MYPESKAVIAHRTAGRIRLRIAERRGQIAYFASLQRALADRPGVLDVAVNARTASVIIWCGENFELDRDAPLVGLHVTGAAPSAAPAADEMRRNLVSADARLRAASGGRMGLATFLVKLVAAVAAGQVLAQLFEWAVETLVQGARQWVLQEPGRYLGLAATLAA